MSTRLSRLLEIAGSAPAAASPECRSKSPGEHYVRHPNTLTIHVFHNPSQDNIVVAYVLSTVMEVVLSRRLSV